MKSVKNNFVYFEDTLVALFDIQAYSSFIESTPKREAVEKSAQLYQLAKSSSSNSFGPFKTKFWILSDTVVMAIDTTHAPLSFGSAYLFFHACSDLFHGALRFCGLPLRGAIGSGYLYFEEDVGKNEFGDSSFLLGDALVDAAKYERTQNWLGARFTPKAVEVLDRFISKEDGRRILDCAKMEDVCAFGDIPLKGGVVEKGYYLLPSNNVPDWRSFLPGFFEDRGGKLVNTDRLWKSLSQG